VQLVCPLCDHNMKPAKSSSERRLMLSVKWLICLLISGYFVAGTTSSFAMEIKEWSFQTSLYTKHWSEDEDHVNNSKLIDFQFETTKKWLYGFAWFDNSFGQPSQYLYAGYYWDVFNTGWAYVKLTGGLLHGYKDEYQDKIPFNNLGVAPAIVPAIGVRYKRVFGELQILGGAAITVTAGFTFGKKKPE